MEKWDGTIGTLSFLSSGASGELGPCWALMVVMSMLRIAGEEIFYKDLGVFVKEGGALAGKGLTLAVKLGIKVGVEVVLG